MTYRITLLPSNHTFMLEGTETLLDAALRAGYAPDYGCSSGNCGLCRARVISGETNKIKHHDFVAPVSNTGEPEILLCAYSARSDLVLEVEEAGSADDIQVREIRTRVKKVDRSDHDVSVVSLQTPRTQRLRFLAGQTIELQCHSGSAYRLFVASCPCDDRNLQLHVNNHGRPGQDSLVSCLESAQYVDITGPFGNLALNENSPNDYTPTENTQAPAVFINLDDGFAPAKSLIEHAIAIEYEQPVILLRINSGDSKPYLHNLCRSWADALDNFTYLYESGFDLHEGGTEKILGKLRAEAGDLEQATVYLTGSIEFTHRLAPVLEQLAPGVTVLAHSTGNNEREHIAG